MPEPASDDRLSIFISYAHEDEELCGRLLAHLSSLENEGLISHWHDRKIVAGERWDDAIQTQLTSAKLIMLLVSADFLASRYVNAVELPTAIARHNAGEAWTTPVILRPCHWNNTVLRDLQALPRDAKPVTTWNDEDEALLNVVEGVRAVIERLSVSEVPGFARPGHVRVEQRLKVTRPGILRFLLDRYLPSLHRFLSSNLGTLSKPAETDALNNYLRDTRANIENDIRHKTYIPLAGKEVSSTPLQDHPGSDPFVPPMQRVIRQVVGRERGGDSASAQIAAVNRHSRVIRNIIRTLLGSSDPLVLLGDPGTGKTMTLQQTALRLFDSEIKRVFPIITLYIRLGEFYVSSDITPEEVWKYVKASVSPQISPYLEDLDSSGRLIVLFDGMDEMSRERYSEHTKALSIFAAAGKGRTKTLFSCRITDFSPKFVHRRLVLLPFNENQIAEYLRRYIPFPLTIEGESWTLKRLVRELLRGSLPLEATNPFVLWLLCFQLQQKGSWPDSRVELLRFYIEETYRRKSEDLGDGDGPFPPVNKSLTGWSKFAYEITNLNRGAAIAVPALTSENGLDVEELIRVGKRCGVLQESTSEEERQIRFEHHRFQEFFTAQFINQRQTKIAWLDKLDAPRWQETMLNLILMGGGEDAIRTLAEAIEDEMEPPDSIQAATGAADRKLSPQRETMLADRIELASRIIRQAAPSSPLVRTKLTEVFRKAIGFLAEHGNPITQVKMMRACQNVPEVDIFQVLQKSLKSPIDWVRNQALIIVSSSNRGPVVLSSHFVTELGYDLANGRLPLRMKVYSKAAAASKQRRNWWSLAVAVFVFLLHVSVLMSVAGVACFEAWKILPQSSVSIDVRLFVAACLLLLIAAIGAALKFDPGKLWMAILASGAATVSSAEVIRQVGSDSVPPGGFLILIACAIAAIPLLTASIGFPVALGTHSLALGIYLSATAPVRHSGVTPGSYFRAMWRNCEFRVALNVLGWFAIMALGTAVMWGVVFLVVKGSRLLTEFTHFSRGFSALLIALTITLVGTLLGAGFSAWKHKKPIIIVKALSYFVGTVAVLTLAVPLVRSLNRLTSKVTSADLLQIVVVVIALLPPMALLYTLWLFRRRLQNLLLRWRSWSSSAGSISAEQWKLKLVWADADRQQEILSQTSHQTLGLNADEFLSVLEEVAGSIKQEPALSTYWEKRDRLEQVLRQERQG